LANNVIAQKIESEMNKLLIFHNRKVINQRYISQTFARSCWMTKQTNSSY